MSDALDFYTAAKIGVSILTAVGAAAAKQTAADQLCTLPDLSGKSREAVQRILKSRVLKDSYAIDVCSHLMKDEQGRKRYSHNSGSMLRAYLRHQMEPQLKTENGEEILRSPEWKQLAQWVQTDCQKGVDRSLRAGRWPDESALKRQAQAYFDRRRRLYGIVFGGPLNPIIGGVKNIIIRWIKIDRVAQERGRTRKDYTLSLKLFDSYDFDNNRSDLPVYDAFRRRLTQLLGAGRYGEFSKLYNDAIVDERVMGQRLPRMQVFASLLYAMEKNRLTPGPLHWFIILPMQGVLIGR